MAVMCEDAWLQLRVTGEMLRVDGRAWDAMQRYYWTGIAPWDVNNRSEVNDGEEEGEV